MGVKLREKETKNGVRYYADINHKGKRRYEFFGKSVDKKKAKEIVKKIESDIVNGRFGLRTSNTDDNFLLFHEKYKRLEHFRVYRACIAQLETFIGKKHLPCSEITEQLCQDFKAHLINNLNGETPHNYMKVFKRMLKDATRAGYFEVNPSSYVVNENNTRYEVKKDVLFESDILKLYETPCNSEEVKRAFIFAIHTGLRYCDIVTITDQHVKDINGEMFLVVTQSKTRRQNIIPLSDTALKIISGHSGRLFRLPSQTRVNYHLKNWATAAKLTQHVTFHVARHTAVSNWYLNSKDLKVAGQLAGHSSIKETEKYLHLLGSIKRSTVNSLPELR